jgi:flagellar basal-body rod modification protein FlgD
MDINSLVSGNTLSAESAGKTSKEMGKEDFLNLLVLQMQNQDPLEPMDNQAMLAQMAQFSSLEQMSNLNDNFTNANSMSSFMDATRLIGKEVSLLNPNSSPENPEPLVSEVKSVSFSSSGPVFTLSNGTTVTAGEILQVSQPVEEI